MKISRRNLVIIFVTFRGNIIETVVRSIGNFILRRLIRISIQSVYAEDIHISILAKSRRVRRIDIVYVLCQDNDGQRHDETFISSQELSNQNLHGDTTTEVARRTPSASRSYANQGTNKATTIYNSHFRDI